ncbi:unnamed protein product [Periconia digitata]|uniref:Uncharacterized protein n=1 Tax=Periconia digitata TaxID=1303443 RepID=A0A9W4UQ00_9PLEO|nr:unnamed protein product [Periconia digitata]
MIGFRCRTKSQVIRQLGNERHTLQCTCIQHQSYADPPDRSTTSSLRREFLIVIRASLFVCRIRDTTLLFKPAGAD